MTNGLRVVVLGYVVRFPLGGMAWHYLQYVLGLARMGHDVFFFEDSDDYPSCYDPVRSVVDENPTFGLDFARRSLDEIGLGERWAYYDAHTSRWFGPRADDATGICEFADIVLNISGANPLRSWTRLIPHRVFIDTDPVFEQIRQLTVPERRELAQEHTSFLTFGCNIGRSGSRVPEDGLPWQPTRQPIVLDAWRVTPGPSQGLFTTIMQWDSYREREFGGVFYGLKSRSFEPFLRLPERAGPFFELALGTPDAPRDLLRSAGWNLVDPRVPTRSLASYQEYIRNSKAEFSIAKHGFVQGWSGWFSERSAGYLASGRPVALQDTGYSDWLPTGDGLIPFSTMDEAEAAIRDIIGRYEHHCRSARELAAEYFDSDRVLDEVLSLATEPMRSQ